MTHRTPLRTEAKWFFGFLLLMTLAALAGFALFMQQMRAL